MGIVGQSMCKRWWEEIRGVAVGLNFCLLSDKEAERSRFVKRLFTLGRHYDVNVILISQTSNVAT